jgi:hypothetical protein
MRTKLAALVAFALSAGVLPIEAHHSFAAEYDASKAVRITGIISKVEWTNPHSYLYIDVKDEQGKFSTWTCEGGAPNTLSRRGFTRNAIKLGDTVTIDGYGAKDGSRLMDARRITLSDGRTFYSGSPGDGGPGDPGKSQ